MIDLGFCFSPYSLPTVLCYCSTKLSQWTIKKNNIKIIIFSEHIWYAPLFNCKRFMNERGIKGIYSQYWLTIKHILVWKTICYLFPNTKIIISLIFFSQQLFLFLCWKKIITYDQYQVFHTRRRCVSEMVVPCYSKIIYRSSTFQTLHCFLRIGMDQHHQAVWRWKEGSDVRYGAVYYNILLSNNSSKSST